MSKTVLFHKPVHPVVSAELKFISGLQTLSAEFSLLVAEVHPSTISPKLSFCPPSFCLLSRKLQRRRLFMDGCSFPLWDKCRSITRKAHRCWLILQNRYRFQKWPLMPIFSKLYCSTISPNRKDRTVRKRFHFRLSLLDFQRNKHL